MRRLFRWMRIAIPKLVALVLVLNGMLYVLTAVLAVVDDTFFAEAIHEANYWLDVSTARHLSGALGLLLGFLLMFLGRGLFNRYRRSWWLAVATLMILVTNSFFLSAVPQVGYLSFPLLIILLASYRWFDQRPKYGSANAQTFLAWVSVIFALIYGVVGCYLIRSGYNNLKTWTDAVYFTFITYSTVGYGDIYPVTQAAKFFTISMLMIGLGSFAAALSFVVGPMLEQRMKGVLNMMKKFHNLNKHVVLCGYTNVTKFLINELQAQDVPFVVIENRPERNMELQNLGYSFIPGSSAQKATFEQAHLQKASAVIMAYDDDAANILSLLTIREVFKDKLPDKFKVIVRIDQEENIAKAETLGVDHIVSPATMAAKAMLEIYKK